MLSKPVCVCLSACVYPQWNRDAGFVFPFPVIVNRSRAAFMCGAHYHGNGCDGNLGAAQVWQATVCRHKPHKSTFYPLHMLFTLSAQTFGPDSVWTEHWRLRLWFRSHLSPQQLPHADENAPQPLVNCESRTGERLPSELNDDDLRRRRNMQVQQRADPNVLSDPSCSSVLQSSIKSTSMSHTAALGDKFLHYHCEHADLLWLDPA